MSRKLAVLALHVKVELSDELSNFVFGNDNLYIFVLKIHPDDVIVLMSKVRGIKQYISTR